MAKTIIDNNSLVKFNETSYKYTQQHGGLIRIDINAKTCTCPRYQEKLACKHLVAACLKDNVHLDGLQAFPKKLLTVKKRKRLAYLDSSLNHER